MTSHMLACPPQMSVVVVVNPSNHFSPSDLDGSQIAVCNDLAWSSLGKKKKKKKSFC